MPLDTNIPLMVKSPQLDNPLNTFAKFQDLQTNKLKMDEYQAGVAEKNALARLVTQPGFDASKPESQNAILQVAPRSGPAILKSLVETKAAGVDLQGKELDLHTKKVDKAITDIAAYNSPEDVLAGVKKHLALGDIDEGKANAIIGALQAAPDFRTWQAQTLHGLLSAKDQLQQHYSTQDLGGSSRVVATPMFAGGGAAQVVPGTEAIKTATPGENLAHQDRIRGQDMAASRASMGGQYGLSDAENEALFGPNGAVARGKINPDRINSRTGHILAKAAMANPDLDMVNAAGVAAMMKNPTFQNKAMVADTLPAIIASVTDAGKKVDFSDLSFVGKMQAYTKGQLNDPDFISYMAQRNDAIQAITNVMRGVGMSDKSIELELKAAPDHMSPKAFDAWAAAQNKMLKPRLEKYAGVSLDTRGRNAATSSPEAPAAGKRLSPAEAAKLPSGTTFVGEDGVTRVKH